MIISNLNASYDNKPILVNYSLEIPEGAITAVLGKSGCGKTTLLNAIASIPSRELSYVFQEPRLIPWLTLERNITLALTGSREERRRVAREYLANVGLAGREGEYPDRVSGGERQRVSIARAFARKSALLLMDEPFQAQDPLQKRQLQELFLSLHSRERRTVIAVTHDVEEALYIADTIIVLSGPPVVTVFSGSTREPTGIPVSKERLMKALS